MVSSMGVGQGNVQRHIVFCVTSPQEEKVVEKIV